MKKSEQTRQQILQTAFELIYVRGFQTTSVDDIIAKTQVTKGAFYYHFKNKDEMGLAIINEILKPTLSDTFLNPFETNENPLEAIYQLMHILLLETPFLRVEYGCPAANFTQEMAPWNETFRVALDELTLRWNEIMSNAIENGKLKGFVKQETQSSNVTTFIMSGYWGIRNFGKLTNDKNTYLPYLKELKSYLNSLKQE